MRGVTYWVLYMCVRAYGMNLAGVRVNFSGCVRAGEISTSRLFWC